MASYAELAELLFMDTPLRNQVRMGAYVAADNIVDSPTPTDAQKQWGRQMYTRETQQASEAFRAVLVKNRDLEVSQIRARTDDEIVADVEAMGAKYIQGGIWPTT